VTLRRNHTAPRCNGIRAVGRPSARCQKLAACPPLCAPSTPSPVTESRRSLQFSGCTNRSQASRVEQKCSEPRRFVVWLYGEAAMDALRPVHDGVDVSATTPAAIVAVKASTVQKDRRDLAHFFEAGGAAARQARVACGYAGSIDEQSAHRLDKRHVHPSRGAANRAPGARR
jgi:hypothetical protein